MSIGYVDINEKGTFTYTRLIMQILLRQQLCSIYMQIQVIHIPRLSSECWWLISCRQNERISRSCKLGTHLAISEALKENGWSTFSLNSSQNAQYIPSIALRYISGPIEKNMWRSLPQMVDSSSASAYIPHLAQHPPIQKLHQEPCTSSLLKIPQTSSLSAYGVVLAIDPHSVAKSSALCLDKWNVNNWSQTPLLTHVANQ